MRWVALLLGASCMTMGRRGAAQGGGGGGASDAREGRGAAGRVTGRVTILEKDNRPSRDLGTAVVYLEGVTPPAPPLPTPAPAPHPASVDVAINDKEFVPRVVVVPVGSTVRFLNHDPFDHNVFSASDVNPFDLGQYGRGEARAWTFGGPGLTRVFCNVHPRMVMFVQVMAGRYYAQPDADGGFEIADVPPGRYVLHVWHERSPQVTQEVLVTASGVSGIELQLDARGFHWVPHKNKYGKDYPTNAGRERY
jgi:plastocyanin